MIVFNTLSYNYDGEHPIFANASLSIADQKIGLVGPNGSGKTTLLKVLMGELKPTSGNLNVSGTIGYLPQNLVFDRELSAKDILGVGDKLDALEKIAAGSVDKHYYEIVGDDWNLHSKLEKQLSLIGLGNLDLNSKLSSLSGGQITWLALSSLFLHNFDVLLLDEPTNNLDLNMRVVLADYLKHWKKGALIVSHDRSLLEAMDIIVELSPHGLMKYGGNYSLYNTQKEIEAMNAQKNLNEATRQLKKVKNEVQRSQEKKAKKDSSGKKQSREGGQAKIILNKAKERSEFSKGKTDDIKERKISTALGKLAVAKDQIIENAAIDFSLIPVGIPQNKIILKISDLQFKFQNGALLLDNFNLLLKGSSRVGVIGSNASGKSTLLNLITGKLKSTSGTIHLGTRKIALLDQAVEFLDLNTTVLENVIRNNPKTNETKLRERLAQFLFGSEKINKLISELSGGERVRIGLTSILAGDDVPELLILDEPTNHMDFYNLQSFTQILNQYSGALIVVSHDQHFLNELNLSMVIDLDSNSIAYGQVK